MFAGRAAAEILAGHEDAASVAGVVEYEILLGRPVGIVTPVAEEVVPEELLVPGHRLEKAGGNNLVRVHILQGKRDAGAFYDVKFLFHGKPDDYWRKSLGSVMTPVTAAAAAVSGLASRVREPGPWRPSKLRLLVETAYFPAGILSSFIARQAEQPG